VGAKTPFLECDLTSVETDIWDFWIPAVLLSLATPENNS